MTCCNFKLKINKSLNDFILMFILVLYFVFYNSFVVPIAIAPDEQAADFFSSLLIEKNEFDYTPSPVVTIEGAYKSTADGFFFNNETGKYVAGTFPGFIYLSAILKSTGILFYYISPIFSVLCLLLFYLFIRKLFQRKIALISTILLGMSPLYTQWSVLPYQDICSLFYFFVLMLLITYSGHKNDPIWNILIGLVMGWWIFMRYTNAIFIPALIIFYLLLQKDSPNFKIKTTYKEMKIITASFLVFLFSIFIFNKMYYSKYVTIPTVAATNESLSTGFIYFSKYLFNQSIIEKIYLSLNHIIVYSNYIIPLSSLAILFMIYSIKNRNNKLCYLASTCFLIFTLGAYIFYTGTKPFYWTSAHYSTYRYLLPAYCLLIPLISFELTQHMKKAVKILMICVFVISSMSYIYTLPFNIFSISQSKIDYLNFHENIESSIPSNNTVVLAGYWTKIISQDKNIINTQEDTSTTPMDINNLIGIINELLSNTTYGVYWIPNIYESTEMKKDLDDKYNLITLAEYAILDPDGKSRDVTIYQLTRK